MSRKYWLFKSEPSAFSIADLKHSPNRTACWDGVRNYQARNFLRDAVNAGDGVLFYHSSVPPVGIAGEAVVVREGYPDKSAFDRSDAHYDSKSRRDKPVWFTVDIQWVRECKNIISLPRLRAIPGLKEMNVLRRGMRLSVQPVAKEEWSIIMKFPEWDSEREPSMAGS